MSKYVGQKIKHTGTSGEITQSKVKFLESKGQQSASHGWNQETQKSTVASSVFAVETKLTLHDVTCLAERNQMDSV